MKKKINKLEFIFIVCIVYNILININLSGTEVGANPSQLSFRLEKDKEICKNLTVYIPKEMFIYKTAYSNIFLNKIEEYSLSAKEIDIEEKIDEFSIGKEKKIFQICMKAKNPKRAYGIFVINIDNLNLGILIDILNEQEQFNLPITGKEISQNEKDNKSNFNLFVIFIFFQTVLELIIFLMLIIRLKNKNIKKTNT